MASTTAKRYARAVFDLARESNDVDGWRARLARLQALLDDRQVAGIVANPAVSPERRLQVVDVLDADGELGREGRNLGKLLIEARATAALPEIREEYDRLDDEAAGRVRAVATSAVPLSDEDRERLVADLSRRFQREVRLQTRVDPSILGGLVVQVGDQVIDASVQTRLQQLRRQLATA
ncbi:MAG: F0F1 ATP synthase subunit delta [Candidatus Dormibacteraeota bacterium]|nr:F0F1 ATP synthase subunit delta [Candidatus Dormibacteraeota bacterium]MBO0743795.1 F0F1 ATP synthase subunit delta [Candidatus Dormibacteraeota bacterium]